MRGRPASRMRVIKLETFEWAMLELGLVFGRRDTTLLPFSTKSGQNFFASYLMAQKARKAAEAFFEVSPGKLGSRSRFETRLRFSMRPTEGDVRTGLTRLEMPAQCRL